MRLPERTILSLSLIVSQVLLGQDSLKRSKLNLCDVSITIGSAHPSPAELNINYVKSFTGKNKIYFEDTFTNGFSDTAATVIGSRYLKQNPHGPPSENNGSTFYAFGFNAGFGFRHNNHNILRRLKPRLGIYHTNRSFFSYNMRSNKYYKADSLSNPEPGTPPIVKDSSSHKNINYQFRSKQIYAEVGLNFDIYRSRSIIVYTGILYVHGLSYKNTFEVRKDEYSGNEIAYSSTEIIDNEPSSFSSRVTIPFGISLRLAKKKPFSTGFYFEVCPGYEYFKIKGGRSVANYISSITLGLRFNFYPHIYE